MQLKALVIDDDQAMRESLEMILSAEGISVVTAESGTVAVNLARHQRFDVALTDLKMPGMSGLDTLIALKNIDPTLPIIVVSAYISGDTASDCMSRGAFALLRKPFKLTDLIAVTWRALEVPGKKSAELP